MKDKDIRQNYLQLQGWMVQDLNLKGNDLLAFGLIYGFCQDGNSEFTGSIDYVCTWLNASRPTVSKSLSNLCEKELIIKRIEIINNVQFNRYKINLQVVKKLYGGSKETLQGGSKETLHNNTIIDNTKDNVVVTPEPKNEIPEVPEFVQQQQQQFKQEIENSLLLDIEKTKEYLLEDKEVWRLFRAWTNITERVVFEKVLNEFLKIETGSEGLIYPRHKGKSLFHFQSWTKRRLADTPKLFGINQQQNRKGRFANYVEPVAETY